MIAEAQHDAIRERFGPAWADRLQGRIRSMIARAEQSPAAYPPSATRREINTLIVKAFTEREEV